MRGRLLFICSVLALPVAVALAAGPTAITIVGPAAPKVTITDSEKTATITVIGTKPPAVIISNPAAMTATVVTPGLPGPPGQNGRDGRDGKDGASAWNDISGKPSVFPPDTHSQAISTVTGLQTALDGKQAALGYTPVNTTDPRLSDARMPLSHNQAISTVTGLQTALDGKQAAGSYQAAGDYATNSRLDNYTAAVAQQMAGKEAVGIASSLIASHNMNGSSHSGQFVAASDPRMYDARPPLDHNQDIGTVNGLQTALDSKATLRQQATLGNISTASIFASGSISVSGASRLYNVLFMNNQNIVGAYTLQASNLQTGGVIKSVSSIFNHVDSVGINHSAASISGLATVATSGSYPDLFNKPTIPVACGTDPATAIFDGAPGVPALFCNITGGRRNVVFDATGRNPTGMSPFSALLYEGSNLVTPMYWSWFTGGASNAIYGTGLSSSFTPTVRASFSIYSSQNNYVGAYLTYSSIYGKRAARCYAAVAVSKIGDAGLKGDTGNTGAAATIAVGTVTTGAAGTNAIVTNGGSSSSAVFNFTIPKGDTGDPGTITQDQILTKVKEVSTAVLERSSNSAGSVMIQVKDATASHNVRFFVTDTGLIYTKDEYGKVRWGFDEPNKKFIMGNYSNGSIRRNYEVDTFGQEKRFATDGKTVIYQSYTTGREKWFSTAGKLQRHKFPDGKIITYRPDGITPAFTNRTTAALVIGG